VLHPGVVVYPHSILGADCVVHAGTVIGSDGFGFRHTSAGWVKTPQVGNVEIGDKVEIGANCAIDCGRFGPTRIGSGTKLDNHVHVGHNVDVGEHCLLIAKVGIAGSTRIGRGVILAGGVGVAGHLEIGAGARVAAGSGVITDVPAGADWFGYPAKPQLHSIRISKELDRLPNLRRRVRALERLAGIEHRSSIEPEREVQGGDV
jgi:UDP-3-O-[3-hydroxymyristoyl] glucosamine N-acyltransferase